jgi:probable HAF family extracellular repeat protein
MGSIRLKSSVRLFGFFPLFRAMCHGRGERLRVMDGSRLVVSLLMAFQIGFPGIGSASLVMIDLGTLGGDVGQAFGINANGQVVGLSLNAFGEQHAFVWTQDEGMAQIGTPGNASYAISASDTGQVAGTYWIASGVYHAFSWTRPGGLIDLGTLGGVWSVANAASIRGQVVGYSFAADYLPYAFSWTPTGGMVNLGLGTATAVNENGQVVGQDGATHAFSWTEEEGMVNIGEGGALAVSSTGQVVGINGVALGATQAFLWTKEGGRVGLGTLGGGNAWASDVNASGQVVGTSEMADGSTRAFWWKEGETRLSDLGTLGGKSSDLGYWDHFYHRALNASGQVVGWSETTDGSVHAFSWTKEGGMVDLGTLGGSESAALAVNDRGDIVGYSATADGRYHAVLWKVKPLMVTPAKVNLGKVLKGAISERTVSLRNAGTVPLSITGIGTPAPPFSIAGGGCSAPQVLPAGDSCTLVVRFSPATEGPVSSSFNITSTDPEEPSLTVELSGRAVLLLATPAEGSIGDEVTITGAVGFGSSKGKVLIGGVAPKITEWTDSRIKATLSKVPIPDVPREVTIQPKIPKGAPPISEQELFTSRGPKISGVDSMIVTPGSTRIIFGNIFLTKKGKVTLEQGGKVKSCRIVSWKPDQIEWLVPKLTTGEAKLKVTTKAGSSTWTVFVGEQSYEGRFAAFSCNPLRIESLSGFYLPPRICSNSVRPERVEER